jgi:hypothetical protein
VTWTSRSPKAPWTARYGHTSVIDAAGAIYVLGGYDGKYLADVWVSTNGGEDPTRYTGVLMGTRRVLMGTPGVNEWYSRGTEGALTHRDFNGSG